MPELPEVETVRRGLQPLIAGQTIRRVRLNRENLRFPFPVRFAARLEGGRITGIDRRAKYLLIHVKAGGKELILVAHLGMSGKFFVARTDYKPDRHDHVVIELENGSEIVFNDARRFGSMDLVTANEVEGYKGLAGLGPEPLGNDFSGPVLHTALAKRKTSIKAALMDQRVVAGLGNIYVCEGLFGSSIDPRRMTGSLTKKETDALATSIRQVLNAALASGGSSLRDYVTATGEAGYFQHEFQVYGHEGDPCKRCSKGIVMRIVQAGRSTFFCPHCQH